MPIDMLPEHWLPGETLSLATLLSHKEGDVIRGGHLLIRVERAVHRNEWYYVTVLPPNGRLMRVSVMDMDAQSSSALNGMVVGYG